MDFKIKNLLVTGGAGFIGSNFINYLVKNKVKVNIYNLDDLTYAANLNNDNLLNHMKNYIFIKGNICDYKLLSEVFFDYKIDGVINFAAETHVDNSIISPDNFIKSNINGVFNLLKISNKFWMKKPYMKKKHYENSRFHQVSTDEVYGSIETGSFNEKSQFRPNSPYSASKASGDMLVRSFYKTYGLNVTTSFCSNNFGPNQHSEKLIPKVIHCLLNNKSIPVYGDGLNVRDWLFVEDHCLAIEKIYNHAKAGECYNIGGNSEITNLELIKLIAKLMGIKPKIKFVKDRYGHDKRYSLDCSKIEKELKINTNNNFEKNLKKYLKTLI